jgi:hypothetical protein
MSAKHTPGPWHVAAKSKDSTYTYHGVYTEDGSLVCSVAMSGPVSAERRIKDAQLLAAAPDLLQALTDACAAMAVGMTLAQKTPGSFDSLTTLQICFAQAREAIERAGAT